jgi:hypothetical protein
MQWLKQQVGDRRRPLVILAAYALIVGALSFALNAAAAVDGEGPAAGQALVGLLGVTAAVLAWLRWSAGGLTGWHLMAAWVLVQIPVFAWTTDGSLTEQVIRFPLVATSRTEVNGELTSYSEIGLNLVAIVLAIVVFKWRKDFVRPRIAAPV